MGKVSKDPLGDRMKAYEVATNITLIKGTPKIIRLDGKAFHTWVKKAKCQQPFDDNLMYCMIAGATAVMQEIGGIARFAYLQSDECSIVLNDMLDIYTEPWFGNKVQKMVSVAAAIMSVNFTLNWGADDAFFMPPAYFDSRVFQMPSLGEMHNAILWRQFDASKNSISQYARNMFSHKELYRKNGKEMQEMMFQKNGFNWNNAPTWTKRGVIIRKIKKPIQTVVDGKEVIVDRSFLEPDWEIPKFNENPDYLYNLFLPEEVKENGY